MAEYIEREKVEKMLDQLYDGHGEKWCNAIDAAIMDLTDIPAADARPERHGHWDTGYFHDRVCSCCLHPDNDLSDYAHTYCPHCGAKMDGKDGESE